MNWWIPLGLALFVAALWVAHRQGWVDFSTKVKRGNVSGAFGAIDEVFAPHRHEIEALRERQAELPLEKPVPGDGDLGIAAIEDDEADGRFDGRIRIDL